MNRAYRDLVRARIAGAATVARELQRVQHPELRGHLRELVVRDILRPFLPPTVGIGTWEIISAKDEHSSQIDVVLYEPGLVPPVLFEQSTGLFPIESVLYTIEVKSTLTAAELRTAHEAALRLSRMHYDMRGTQALAQAVCILFAFASDLAGSGKTEAERYREVRGATPSALKGLCVLGAGYWFLDQNLPDWELWKADGPFDEVIGLLVGILNTLREIPPTRGAPRMGGYLLQDA